MKNFLAKTLLLFPLAALTLDKAAANFTIDGNLDSPNYLVNDNGMRLWAAVRGNKLYFATWSATGGTQDHFVLCTANFGNPESHPWAKDGQLNFFFGGWPWLAAEGDPTSSPFATLNNGGTSGSFAQGPAGQVLEGEIDLVEVFGSVPDILYLAALAYGDNDGDGIAGQSPTPWTLDNNLEVMEYAPVSTAAIRDEDADGYWDAGNPSFSSTVDGNTSDANYGLRRFFLNELNNESATLSFAFTPNINPVETVSNVELITNLNRRHKATILEDRNLATSTSDTEYRAYPMTNSGGIWSTTLTADTCGAYRATVRYQVDGTTYYYTDSAQRRDLAIVVSPTKALTTTLYEVNPTIVEATGDQFADRSTFQNLWQNTNSNEAVSVQKFNTMGVNMLWLQPIHPIGIEARETDPSTSQPYDPGSPYAVQDYWQVAPFLGDQNTQADALAEFQEAVTQFDNAGIGIMMDGTFNHSAPDATLGQGAVDLFSATSTDLVRNTRPGWYSKSGNYSLPATNASEQALAPDRRNFGKWTDVRDFYFGTYDTLVAFDSDSHTQTYLLERDAVDPISSDTEDLWEYFAYYPLYWLAQTGHPVGTPANESYKGIDGLRCDFAQGLPSQFWEYCINKTRTVKWDFLFMAESLDGTNTVGGSDRHGVSYRSARHFDILNENIVFYWRDSFFAYLNGTPNPSTGATFNAYSQRNAAFEGVSLLNNLTSHDEIFPTDSPYALFNAYCQVAALKGVPMTFYGQEAGAQNDVNTYGSASLLGNDHNFNRYELNFGKSIPNFKRWNHMSNIWTNRDTTLESLYGRVNNARLNSPALLSENEYFLATTSGGLDNTLFAVAKYEEPGLSPASQDVVFAVVNNDPLASLNRSATFDLSPESSPGTNLFGIDPTATYNLVDLLSTNPSTLLWPTDRTGQDLLDNGLTVILNQPLDQLGQAQYLQLLDTSSPTSIEIVSCSLTGNQLTLEWTSSPGTTYLIESSPTLTNFQPLPDALNPTLIPASNNPTTSTTLTTSGTTNFYRIAEAP
ncbi:MAG: alpha-amylase family glycosyl hydrolase [Verrucomicrobiota bacterium]